MRMYRVKPRVSTRQLLEVIQSRGQFPYPSRDFACEASADAYAFWITLQTGQQPERQVRDPDQYATLREKIHHLLGVDE